MPNHFQVMVLIAFTALTSCGEKKAAPDSLSIEVSKDSRSGFGDFLAGLAYLTEKEPLKLDIHRDGKRFEITVHSLRHDSGPIEPYAMILTKEGPVIGRGDATATEIHGMKGCGESLAMFAKGCKAADVEPIVLLSAGPGVGLEDGIELLKFMAEKGVSRIVVADDHYSGPDPEKTRGKPPFPRSHHPPTPPSIHLPAPSRDDPVSQGAD